MDPFCSSECQLFFKGHELLKALLSTPRGNLEDHVFLKAYYLTSFLKHVSPLAAVAFAFYSVLIKLPLICFIKATTCN